MAISKNNKRVLSTPTGPYTEVGQFSRFVPLQGGHAYLRDPRNGKNYHVRINSERFDALIDEFISVIGKDRLLPELEALARRFPEDGWHKALTRVRDAG